MALLSALGHLANFGQFVEIGQGHAHQREQIRWSRRSYTLDAEALKIDLLGTAREGVRGTYDTYVERLDSLLLLNALLLPFALNTLQFSNQFVPGHYCKGHEDPEACIEARHWWIQTLWVYAVGLDLFIPFWSLLLLLKCKAKLDAWLQDTLYDLHELRKTLLAHSTPSLPPGSARKDIARHEEAMDEELERIVLALGQWMLDYQDLFSKLWTNECLPLVSWAKAFLWSSVFVAVGLTAFMFWIYLVDAPGGHNDYDHVHFAILAVLGLCLPIACMFFSSRRCSKVAPRPDLPFPRASEEADAAAVPIAASTRNSSPLLGMTQADRVMARRNAASPTRSPAASPTASLALQSQREEITPRYVSR